MLRYPALAVALLLLAAEAPPPVAEKRPHALRSPHGTRNDPYYWLRDDTRSKPDVLAYLNAENAYFEARSADFNALTQRLTDELIGRLKQDDSTAPYKYKDYLYYTRYERGKQYPIHVRRPIGSDREQILVDANREAGARSTTRPWAAR